MKKIYITPNVRFVELENEEGILTSSNVAGFNTNEADAVGMDAALSNKQDLWGNEDIWN